MIGKFAVFITLLLIIFMFLNFVVNFQFKHVKNVKSLRGNLLLIKFCLGVYLIACFAVALGSSTIGALIISVSLPLIILSIQEISSYKTTEKLYIKLAALVKGGSEAKVNKDIHHVYVLLNQVEERVPGYRSKELNEAKVLLEKIHINK